MKIKTLLFVILFLIPIAAFADNATVPFTVVEAKELEYIGSHVKASGDVKFVYDNIRMTCDSIEYDFNTKTGRAENLRMTTCERDRQHYHLRCKEAELSESGMIKAKRISVYLGKAQLMYLPFMMYKVGTELNKQLNFPVLGYSSNDGLSIRRNFTFADTDRFSAKGRLMLATKSHVRANVKLRYAFDNTLRSVPATTSTTSGFMRTT